MMQVLARLEGVCKAQQRQDEAMASLASQLKRLTQLVEGQAGGGTHVTEL